ncbi:MAG: E3 ubiquitin-protein ligase rad18 [Vezdaea aestivalis]|nr:MAG: E3 ubiquitin-protein ligase rad18 [Vezdaea aestivalis]
MTSLDDIPDSTDWLETRLDPLSSIESELRCQVCKDFFDTPMITSCSHTFCALCIRRCLAAEGKCPACRSQEQEVRLRRNDTVASLVEIFQAARPALLAVARETPATIERASRPKKRKADRIESSAQSSQPEEEVSRRTRSRINGKGRESRRITEDEISLSGSENEEQQGPSAEVQCPMCDRKMKQEQVWAHVETCANENIPPPPPSRRVVKGPLFHESFPTERLPRLNFSMMKDTALRKKLTDLGLPNQGLKSILMKRYDEWVNLVNSNIDSQKPLSARQLKARLSSWERSQGLQSNGIASHKDGELVMDKAFDKEAWSAKHNSDFQDLIIKARPVTKALTQPEPGQPSTERATPLVSISVASNSNLRQDEKLDVTNQDVEVQDATPLEIGFARDDS